MVLDEQLNGVRIEPASLNEVIAIHRQMPADEFEPDYIDTNYNRIACRGGQEPFRIIGYIGAVATGYLIGFDKPDSMRIWMTGVLNPYRRLKVLSLMVESCRLEALKRGHDMLTVRTAEKFQAMIGALGEFGFTQDLTDEQAGTLLFQKRIHP